MTPHSPMEKNMKPRSNSGSGHSALPIHLLAAACVSLAGCVSTAIIKVAPPHASPTSLAEASDERMVATIQTVIVPNSADAWACNAEWDEYRLQIRARTDEPVKVREIAIFDALEQRIKPRSDRGELVEGTLDIEQRYAQSGKLTRVRGTNGWVLVGAGVAGVGGGTATAVAAWPGILSTASFGAGPGALMLVGGSLFLAHAGIARLVNNAEINGEIKRRHTLLPVDLPRGAAASFNLFFPITPLSGRAEVVYVDSQGEHRLHIDTRQLRVESEPESPTLLQRRDPKFPDEVRRTGISEGYVAALLTLDRHGRVRGVNVVEAVPPHVFIMEARRNFQVWTYNEGRNDCRIVEAKLEFKR